MSIYASRKYINTRIYLMLEKWYKNINLENFKFWKIVLILVQWYRSKIGGDSGIHHMYVNCHRCDSRSERWCSAVKERKLTLVLQWHRGSEL